MQGPALQECFSVVLVEPQGPRNVGAVARAMQNFGLSDLRLVKGVPPTHSEALGNAVTARPLLEEARRFETLAEAVADCGYVVGTTARRRERLVVRPPREAAPELLDRGREGRVALLFGREDHGLSKDELWHCHEALSIPAHPGCRSLNLAQAVLIVAYELFQVADEEVFPVSSAPGRVLNRAALEVLREDLSEALRAVGVLHSGTAVAIDQSLRRLVSLAPIPTRDARWLFKLARGTRRRLAPKDREESPPGPAAETGPKGDLGGPREGEGA